MIEFDEYDMKPTICPVCHCSEAVMPLWLKKSNKTIMLCMNCGWKEMEMTTWSQASQ